jgi:hypothetical protein
MPTRRSTWAMAAWLGITLMLCFAMPSAAYGHAGNLLQLYVNDLAVRPAGSGGWTIHAEVIDADSGRPAPGFDVVASGAAGAGRFGPVSLDDPGNTGRYEGVVAAPAGPWTILLEAKPRPGGEPAVPFARTWHLVANDAGTAQPASVDPPSAHRWGGAGWAPAATVVALGLAAGAAIALTRRRRRVMTTC